MAQILPRGEHSRRNVDRKASFVVKPGPEAACFDVAFGRFIELKGRTLADPRGPCAIEAHNQARREVKVVSLWSRKAVDQFLEFWPRYARAFGVDPEAGVLAATKRRGKSGAQPRARGLVKKPSLAV